MAFESLTEKLQNVFKKLRSKGRLTEADVKSALKEVKMALLEADVSFKVVKQFTKSVQEQAVGQDVMNGLNPGQMVIKIVHDELVRLMGSESVELALKPGSEISVVMMVGLQGAGKTTTAAKIAESLNQRADGRFWRPVTSTGRLLLNSFSSTERSRAWKSFLWETGRSLWISPGRRWSMRRAPG